MDHGHRLRLPSLKKMMCRNDLLGTLSEAEHYQYWVLICESILKIHTSISVWCEIVGWFVTMEESWVHNAKWQTEEPPLPRKSKVVSKTERTFAWKKFFRATFEMLEHRWRDKVENKVGNNKNKYKQHIDYFSLNYRPHCITNHHII